MKIGITGADGLLIEVHSNPECALCDGEESIKPNKFKDLMQDVAVLEVPLIVEVGAGENWDQAH